MRNQMITRIGVGLLTASVAMAVVCDAFCETRTPPAKLARPSAEQAAWQDLELGLFIHYDMPVFKPGWDHRQYEKRPEAGLFNPAKLDTDQWLSLIHI